MWWKLLIKMNSTVEIGLFDNEAIRNSIIIQSYISTKMLILYHVNKNSFITFYTTVMCLRNPPSLFFSCLSRPYTQSLLLFNIAFHFEAFSWYCWVSYHPTSYYVVSFVYRSVLYHPAPYGEKDCNTFSSSRNGRSWC